MTYQFGKALTPGRQLDARDIRAMETGRLHELYAHYNRPAQTEDLLDRRLAEELDYSQRLLALTEQELKRRGGMPQLVRQVGEAKAVVGDVAGIVGAQDRCAGLDQASDGMKRRLTREVGADEEPICRRDRIRRN